jgi:NTP pyrophosphatase (non-canonical NTP hydrolase)/very-short-patch-repair endonuclease
VNLKKTMNKANLQIPSHGVKSKEWWGLQKFGKLRILSPIKLNTGCHRKLAFVCECGKHKSIIVRSVTSGKTTSCGQCHIMPSEWWNTKKFGKLRLKNPISISINSKKKHTFICDCGKEKNMCIYDVTNGKTITCGACNEMNAEWWSTQKFGSWKLESPTVLNKQTNNKAFFICDCGNRKEVSVHSVTSGSSKSCGECTKTIRNWYTKNRSQIRTLMAPLEPSEFPSGGPIPLERIVLNSKKFRSACPICKNEYMPSLSRLKSGHGLTCGCSTYQTSTPCYEIQEFLIKNGYSVFLEHKLCGYKYDIFIKESKILIEFNGHLYHKNIKTKQRDTKKKFLAEVYGFKLIIIDDRDWFKNKNSILQQLLQELSLRKQINYTYNTKAEIIAKLDEINSIISIINLPHNVMTILMNRRNNLLQELKYSYEDIMSASINSHHVICKEKNMAPDAAYGNDPFVYYALGLVGEAGELAGALLRAIRSSDSTESKKAAVESELADCIIYSVILAYTTGVDLIKIVNEKAKIVESRARAGYYGK